jgi:hypothetical protein
MQNRFRTQNVCRPWVRIAEDFTFLDRAAQHEAVRLRFVHKIYSKIFIIAEQLSSYPYYFTMFKLSALVLLLVASATAFQVSMPKFTPPKVSHVIYQKDFLP